jgi:hypothetical protein
MRRYEYRSMYAIRAELGTAVIDLLAAGANPLVRDSCGGTALHHLAVGLTEQSDADEQRRLFHVFLDRGVDVNVRTQQGCTAISILLDDDGSRAKQRQRSINGVATVEEIDKEVLGWFEEAGTDWNM